jgi:hypothetical protein
MSAYSLSCVASSDGDLQHVLAEERHPGRAIRLFQIAARGQGRAAVEHADVVQAQEAALEHVALGAIFPVHHQVKFRSSFWKLFRSQTRPLRRARPSPPGT